MAAMVQNRRDPQPHTWKDIVRPLIPRAVLNARNAHKDRKALERYLGMTHAPFVPGSYPAGINLYGDDRAGTGLSRSVELLQAAFATRGIPFSFHRIEEWSGRSLGEPEEGQQTDYAINLFHLQPSVWLSFMKQCGTGMLDGHYNIAFWLWETPELPPEWHGVTGFFDEIWVPSVFVARAIRRVTDIPVKVMYYGIWGESRRQPDPAAARGRYGIPGDAMACLVLYDGRSSIERKNPLAALRAFCEAFPEVPEDVYLIIKGKCFTKRDRRLLQRIVKDRRHIVWVDGLLEREETEDLLAAADVLLSLHRAEGFGLPVAEVMACGGVAVATDYSSTKEFLDASCGCPVGFRLLRTGRDYSLYRRGTVWADPDVADAAAQLRRLYEEPALRQQLGAAARRRIRDMLSEEASGAVMQRRVSVICEC